eukprot:gnl/TRDRNA2_/TRDRNA2_92281_c0_seq1.p1 gnl/TRDRNA2_/TRDRNA2_92281_c0~~gnl/TRDRNA2_/TRDRNA2_92281_c0_seq1.p1  ORF type:complete len:263 (+),score=57.44 gnl/TRDRNA2_/TRDRNA2_92281_c0_seq1:80-790(+)
MADAAASAGSLWQPSDGRFTDYLKGKAGELWVAATEHPMTDAIAAGTVPLDKMRRYLIHDHKFIDAFSVLLASALASAPTLEDRIPGAQFLALILGPENTYFERSFEKLGVTKEQRATPAVPVAADFIALMRAAAKSSFGEQLAVLVVAEWSYLSWGERVHPNRAADLPFYFGEWIDLHSGEYFTSVVEYLRGMLDREAETLSPSAAEKVETRFLEAVRLERDFWNMAWEDGGAEQ